MSKIIKATLEDVCLAEKGAIISGPFGSNISSKYFVSSGVPVIRGNNLSLTYDKFYDKGFVFVTKQKADELNCYAKKRDLIFTAAGTIGQVGIIPDSAQFEEYVISNKQIRATLDCNKINFLYAYYWFSSPWIQEKLIKSNKGSTVPLLTLAEVKLLPIYYPENLTEQIKIAEVIEMFSRKTELNKAINDNLEKQLHTIYDYWFTQFDFPDENGKPYRSSGGKMVWNDELKREIPDGWSAASIISNPLSTVIKPGVTRFDRKTYFATADVNGRNILDGTIISFEGRESRANMQPTINSVWFAKMKNSVKHLILNAEMKDLIENSVLSTGFFGLQVQENAFEYMASFIGSGYFENRKDILAHGATQEAVNNDDLGALYFVIPDPKTLQAFHKATRGIYAKISQNIIENRKLQKLRDWLLPMLMNGQATVTD